MLRFSHKTGLLVNLMDTRGASSVLPDQQALDASTETGTEDQEPASTEQAGPQECEEEDDNLSITEGEFLIIDEVNPQEIADSQGENQGSDKASVLASADVNGATEKDAPLSAPKTLAQKVDTLAEATKEFFKSHPLDVMELQLKQLIPSPSKRYIRMHCQPDNGEVLPQQLNVDDCCHKPEGRKSTLPTTGPISLTQAAPMASPPASAQHMSMPLNQQSNTGIQPGLSSQSQSFGAARNLPGQVPLQSTSYQPRCYNSYQQKSLFCSFNPVSLTDPYSSRYMQHREDRYQPYPSYAGRSYCSSYQQLYHRHHHQQQSATTAQVSSTAAQPLSSATPKVPGPGGTQLSWIKRQMPPPPPPPPPTMPPPPQPPPPPTPPQQTELKLGSQHNQPRNQSQPSGRGRGRGRSRLAGAESGQPRQLDDARGRQQWLCSLCNIGFPDSSLYGLHRQFHDLQNVWQCSACGYQACGVHDFNLHLVQLPHPVPLSLNCINGRRISSGTQP